MKGHAETAHRIVGYEWRCRRFLTWGSYNNVLWLTQAFCEAVHRKYMYHLSGEVVWLVWCQRLLTTFYSNSLYDLYDTRVRLCYCSHPISDLVILKITYLLYELLRWQDVQRRGEVRVTKSRIIPIFFTVLVHTYMWDKVNEWHVLATDINYKHVPPRSTMSLPRAPNLAYDAVTAGWG